MIRRVGRYGWARRATALAFLLLIALGGRAGSTWFRGSTTASEVFGMVRLTDPLAALEVTLATREVSQSLWIGALLLLVVAAILGPVFCGWVCPVGFLLDLNEGLRRRVRHLLGPRGVGWRELTASSELRFFVLGGVLGVSLLAGLPAFQVLSPINVVGWAVAFGAGPALFFVGGLLLADWVAPRVWCRSLCPLGAVYAVVGRVAPFRVRVVLATAGRSPCQLCTRHCPMGIPVMEEYALRARPNVDAIECTRCGACVDACPRGVLRLGFRDPNRDAAPKHSRSHPLEVSA